MIDLHSHILHDIDDGARTLDEALAMAELAARDGIRVIAATPHTPGSSACRSYEPALIRERVAELNARLVAAQLPLEVVPGSEIFYTPSIVERLQRGQLLPYGASRTILLELVEPAISAAFANCIFNLQVAGYRVVLAHPERITQVQRNPNRLVPLIERGVLMQLTAEALLGGQGDRLRAAAETLLTHGMAHLLASDAHGTPPRRTPLLKAARDRAAALIGPAAAEVLVATTPAALLANQPLRLPPARPVAAPASRWWK